MNRYIACDRLIDQLSRCGLLVMRIGRQSSRKQARLTRVVSAMLALIACSCLSAPIARAHWGWPVSFGKGDMENPVGVAVDQSNGNVYVGSLLFSNNDKFDVNHELVSPPSPFGAGSGLYSGVAVNPVNHSVYVMDAGSQAVDTYDPSTGALISSFEVPGSGNLFGAYTVVQIAADAAGNVYVPNAPANEVQVFDSKGGTPTGGVTATISGSGSNALSSPTGVAVDSSGDVWVADDGNNRIEEFAPDGSFMAEVASPGVQAVAVDTSGDVYASVDDASGAHIIEYRANGEQIDDFGSGILGVSSLGSLNSLAFDNANGVIYAVDGGHYLVWQFAQLGVATGNASDVGHGHATLNGSIEPGGQAVTSCVFEYGTTAAYGHSVPCSQSSSEIGSGSTAVHVSADVQALSETTTYHFRLAATNAGGSNRGVDHTFSAFGVEAFGVNITDASNQSYTQAGGHPYEMTTSLSFTTSTNAWGTPDSPDANPKTVRTELPPGLIGNPEATSKCNPYEVAHADCSGATQVGVLRVFTTGRPSGVTSPLYNLVPPAGVVAQFGARFNGFVTAHIDASVRTGADYGISANALYVSAGEGLIGATVTMWGVPAAKDHDSERYCPVEGKINEEAPCSVTGMGPGMPFLSDPTSCTGTMHATLLADSWQEPGVFVRAGAEMPGITGCDKVPFRPTIAARPSSEIADSSTGLGLDVHIPQAQTVDSLREADLRDAVVALPEGIAINPSSANGLQGCSEGDVGYLSGDSSPSSPRYTPEPADCPDASKVGSVEIQTPVIDHPLKGGVYVATQGDNPFGSLLAIYIAVDDPQSGVVIKLAGKVTPDPHTGRLTTTFIENPQLPFEDLKLDFFGGQRAALVTPAACGTYTTTTSLTPWSAPESGPPATPSSAFGITSGPEGAPCGPQGFAPSLVAGMVGNRAGSSSAFTLTLMRRDGEQTFSSLATALPLGLMGMRSVASLCGEPQASAGACPAASKIGHVTVLSGVGSEPVTLPEAGKPQDPVYLTGPYKGAPFGLAIVVPAEAGPFNLGDGGRPVVVRAGLYIDRHSGRVSIVTDPMPSMLQGIPLDIKTVNVTIDREGFMLNPTNCDPMAVEGSVTSVQGATASVSSRFQAAECRSLPFHPSLSAVTQGKTSRAGGAGLHVIVKSSSGQANIKSVRVQLPKQLPSRLATLNHACPAAQFEANPAGCPAESKVGTATAHTPVLPVPLTGPAYYVSHGGAALPNLVLVLQGEGVTIELAGKTLIRNRITSSTFSSIPDVPVARFDLFLPQGPHSALSASNRNLCSRVLRMPTTITGQNGAQIKRVTRIGVTGCGKRRGRRSNHVARSRHRGPRRA